ncbi:MAG: potassium channel family protein [Candidatus Nanopelagicales bacterium]
MGDGLVQKHAKLRGWEESKAANYERLAAYPMFVLSMLFLMAFAITIMGSSSEGDKEFAAVVIPVTWAAFLIDYLIGLTLSPNRLVFVRTHVTQLVAVIFPLLRFLMVVHAFNVMRKLPVRAADKARIYVLYVTTLTMVVAAIMVVLFESKSPQANITTFGNALWWTGETVSTVGYGDFYPVTLGGRIVAGTLFVNGVALLSIITAGLAQRFTSDGRPRMSSASTAAPTVATKAVKAVVSDADETVTVSKKELARLRQLAGEGSTGKAGDPHDHDDERPEQQPAPHDSG